MIDGESLAEAAKETTWIADGRCGKIVGMQVDVFFEGDDGQRFTITGYLASIKVRIVEFRELVRRQGRNSSAASVE